MKRPLAAVFGALVVVLAAAGAGADSPTSTLDGIGGAAAVQAPAERFPSAAADVVTIYNRASALSADVASRAIAAIGTVGGGWALGRGASVGLAAVRRDGAVVQAAPAGFVVPMATTALPLSAVRPLMGGAVSAVLGSGAIVMGRSTADFRGARVGDVVDLQAASGTLQSFTIGMVADDAVIGGTEIVMTPQQADSIGVTTDTRIVLWGFGSRSVLDSVLVAVGLSGQPQVRIRRSWDAFDPDLTIGLFETKRLFGEFAYQPNPDGSSVTVAGDWAATHLPPGRQVLNADIPIAARCNLGIVADLQAALADVAAAGLASAIDVDNANTYGGCYNARFNRIAGDLGFLSRHAWGVALDTNTATNQEGTVPQMNCDVVRIFRRHNFAWGGNFLTPDGMHFEWVGTRRDLYQYPSTYCPNLPPAPGTQSAPAARPDPGQQVSPGRATMFNNDGFATGD